MQQGNVGSMKKKKMEGELGRISAQMPVVQNNVKEKIADTSYPYEFFFRAQNAKKMQIVLHFTIRSIIEKW